MKKQTAAILILLLLVLVAISITIWLRKRSSAVLNPANSAPQDPVFNQPDETQDLAIYWATTSDLTLHGQSLNNGPFEGKISGNLIDTYAGAPKKTILMFALTHMHLQTDSPISKKWRIQPAQFEKLRHEKWMLDHTVPEDLQQIVKQPFETWLSAQKTPEAHAALQSAMDQFRVKYTAYCNQKVTEKLQKLQEILTPEQFSALSELAANKPDLLFIPLAFKQLPLSIRVQRSLTFHAANLSVRVFHAGTHNMNVSVAYRGLPNSRFYFPPETGIAPSTICVQSVLNPTHEFIDRIKLTTKQSATLAPLTRGFRATPTSAPAGPFSPVIPLAAKKTIEAHVSAWLAAATPSEKEVAARKIYALLRTSSEEWTQATRKLCEERAAIYRATLTPEQLNALQELHETALKPRLQ